LIDAHIFYVDFSSLRLMHLDKEELDDTNWKVADWFAGGGEAKGRMVETGKREW